MTVRVSIDTVENMSRSGARNLLRRRRGRRHVILDFRGVGWIGQSFADEIFRVFHRAHPTIRVEAINASHSVTFMIRRAAAE